MKKWLALSACVLPMLAAPAIGVITARGSFLLDGFLIWENGSLREGIRVETRRVRTSISLDSGPRLKIGASARCRIYHDRLVLEKGDAELWSGSEYRIEAGTLRAAPLQPATIVRMWRGESGQILIWVAAGEVRVTGKSEGVPGTLASGEGKAFTPEGAEITPSQGVRLGPVPGELFESKPSSQRP